jgi:hypothetical protein
MPAQPFARPPQRAAPPERRFPWPALGKVALVAGAALASLAVSWQHWINPFVDSGREMNLPVRLAAGERLYRDIVFYYGPAGPWLQSLALRVCGHPCRSWLPLEAACLLLAAVILLLLYRLTAAAGGAASALAATALAAACCLGGPRGGAFIFPYSASNLYALAGALLALTASLRPPSWRRRAAVAGGLALALTARVEIGAAAALILLVATLRTLRTLRSRPGRGGSGGGAAPDAAPLLPALADLSLGVAAAAAVYWVALAGIPWQTLVAQGPLTHMLAMPPSWRHFYGTVSGLGRLDRARWNMAVGLTVDALLLAACAWPAAGSPAGKDGKGTEPPPRHFLRSGLLLCAAAAFVAAYGAWAGPLRWPWSSAEGNLPPLLFPLPLVAAAAALAALRRPLDQRGRARFLLFALAAALAARVVLGFELGPLMAYCALPLPPLVATAAVLACDVLAPRLRSPGAFRRRLAALAVGFAALFLFRLGALAFGPHIVPLATPAGNLRLPWKEARSIAGTLDYLAGRARPGDLLASFPEAGFFNFETGMRNPLREEEIFPGVLDSGREAEVVARLLATRPRFVLLADRPTSEYGARAFGDDYAAGLWSAVQDHYFLAATFGNAREGARIGARGFFIRVYEPIPAPGGR